MSASLSSFEYASCLQQVRTIDHPAVDRKDASVGMCLERGDDFFGVPDLVLGRGEGRVDDGDLRGMDRELAGEALARSSLRFGLEALLVLEVGEDAVDRLDSRGGRAGEAQRARQPVGEAQAAISII